MAAAVAAVVVPVASSLTQSMPSSGVKPMPWLVHSGASAPTRVANESHVRSSLAPTAGEVRWAGREMTRTDRRRTGYMPEERGLYPKQGVLDQLVYLARLKGQPENEARLQATGTAHAGFLVDGEQYLERRMREVVGFEHGERQREGRSPDDLGIGHGRISSVG